jgi:hypothetical protein
MEHLFSPCTRLHDRLQRQNLLGRPERLQEVNLDVSIEEFISAERAFTYGDLYTMLVNEATAAWLIPRAAVACLGVGETIKPFAVLLPFLFQC